MNDVWNRKNHEHFERVKALKNKQIQEKPPEFLTVILSQKQYNYYIAQKYEKQTILEISNRYKVSCSTVCRTLALAKTKILKYYENQMKG